MILSKPTNIDNLNATIWKLTYPNIITLLFQQGFGFVEGLIVSLRSTGDLSVLALGYPFVLMITNMAYGWGVGTHSLTARSIGEGKWSGEDDPLFNVSFFSIIFGAILGTLIFLLLPILLPLSGAIPEVLEQVRLYLIVYIAGVPLIFLHSTSLSLLRGIGNMTAVAKLSIFTTVLNAFLAIIFLKGLGIIPSLGIIGVGLGSIVAKLVATIAAYSYLEKSGPKRLSFAQAKTVLGIGLPVGLAKSAQPLAMMFLNGLLITFGQVAVATRGLGARLDQLFYLPALFLVPATLTLIAKFRGAGQPGLIRVTVKRIYILVLGSVTLLTLIILIWPGLIWNRVTTDPQLMEAGYHYMRLFGWSYPLATLDIINNAILQGLGFGYPTLIISLIRIWAISLPASYLLAFSLGMGSSGMWLAFALGNVVAVIVSTTWVWQNVKKSKQAMHGLL